MKDKPHSPVKMYIHPPALLALPAPRRRRPHPVRFALLMLVLSAAAGLLGWQAAGQTPDRAMASQSVLPAALTAQFNSLEARLAILTHKPSPDGLDGQSPVSLQLELVAARQAADNGQLTQARSDLDQIAEVLSQWQASQIQSPAPTPSPSLGKLVLPAHGVYLPILMYHNPPSDLGTQLNYLAIHGYTSVNPDQVAAALSTGAALPAKPVLITFDDGFETQWQALPLLEQYHMKATFYIIDGGVGSDWHIGANRRLPDPQGGPAYLTWDQIRQMDKNPLFTIGSHTVNHLDLALQNADIQRFEIISGKQQLEAQIGHTVHAFAYPYGAYNNTTIDILKQAGFTTAVTTHPGTTQLPDELFTLHRIRSTYNLP